MSRIDNIKLDQIIKILGESAHQNEAYFGITGNDFPDIQANEDGLIPFARQLLKAVKLFEDRKLNNNESIPINKGNWCYLYGALENVIPVYDNRYEFLKSREKPSALKEKIKGIIFVIFLVIIIFFTLIGIFELIGWFN
ncbi:hypothetical protein BTO05_02930 [Winogradskyella sp. PC-19]|uniref:hypothetical protein n=1 Tax=unclassified Winogradskyella TaxID=2615021 RepID=UPI000B3D330D|nr:MULTISPECIES: hypothetical protein [unclassified Winogradskyella]ARV08643.1 hypothetical protein BTO05_02930 [Winogradskyella sp. PC-19]RZN80265.1 MAG: hypothetical protein EVB12_04290 [Winogradskyella sp.]